MKSPRFGFQVFPKQNLPTPESSMVPCIFVFFPQEIELKMSRLERLREEEQQLFEAIGSEEPNPWKWMEVDGSQGGFSG